MLRLKFKFSHGLDQDRIWNMVSIQVSHHPENRQLFYNIWLLVISFVIFSNMLIVS